MKKGHVAARPRDLLTFPFVFPSQGRKAAKAVAALGALIAFVVHTLTVPSFPAIYRQPQTKNVHKRKTHTTGNTRSDLCCREMRP